MDTGCYRCWSRLAGFGAVRVAIYAVRQGFHRCGSRRCGSRSRGAVREVHRGLSAVRVAIGRDTGYRARPGQGG